MAEGLDFAHQAETGRVDVAQQLVGQGDILLEHSLDVLDLAVVAYQVQQPDYLRMAGRQLFGWGVAVQEEPARCTIVARTNGLAERRHVGQTPGQAQPRGTGGGGVLACVDEDEAPVHPRGQRSPPYEPRQAHADAGLLQLRQQRDCLRVGQRLRRDFQHGVARHRPIHDVRRGHQATEADKDRIMAWPVFLQAV
ncbi:hypothetical protein SDC9_161701 [bioreactor metagenome]|uniref:Uncharacterized protein n=1 Tax=bioreactor metagenome TaxID=1076179 RepID=A0A645FQ54_9ZZZZ